MLRLGIQDTRSRGRFPPGIWSASVGLLGVVLAVGLALGSRAGTPGDPRESGGSVLPAVVTGPANPVAITHAGDGSGRLFIALQAGTIVIHSGSALLPTPFLDISALVLCCGERGLLGVAFHPDYVSNGYVFVNYTRRPDGATVVARYSVSANPDLADPLSAVVLLTVPQPFSNHNGGQLQFGPEGYLYIGTGDGGSGGDPDDRAQDPSDLLGKLLRIDVDHGLPYAIPAANPFVGTPGARGEIWATGLRNPWRFTVDRVTGDLFIGDVGQGTREEIDFQPAASPGGENYGWRLMEGSSCFSPPTGCDAGGLTPPILEYDHSGGNCAVTGGYRYRGALAPHLYGAYFYGDFCSGRIWGATEDGRGRWAATELMRTPYVISTFGEDEAGELYVADYAGGGVYRLTTGGFFDVPTAHWGRGFIDALNRSRLTAGCGLGLVCPERAVTRAEMAVFLMRGRRGADHTPAAPTGVFGDVPATHWAAAWIEALVREGLTAGCGAGRYCPEAPVTRAQMAVFLLRAIDVVPPQSTVAGLFGDVPATHWAAAWIETLVREGLTVGCGGGRYCPETAVTRAQMAVFLVRTFDLPM